MREDNPSMETLSSISLSFLKIHNPGLENDVKVTVGLDTLIQLYLPDYERLDSVVMDFDGGFDSLKVGDVI